MPKGWVLLLCVGLSPSPGSVGQHKESACQLLPMDFDETALSHCLPGLCYTQGTRKAVCSSLFGPGALQVLERKSSLEVRKLVGLGPGPLWGSVRKVV